MAYSQQSTKTLEPKFGLFEYEARETVIATQPLCNQNQSCTETLIPFMAVLIYAKLVHRPTVNTKRIHGQQRWPDATRHRSITNVSNCWHLDFHTSNRIKFRYYR
jgi:hypothetical protein